MNEIIENNIPENTDYSTPDVNEPTFAEEAPAFPTDTTTSNRDLSWLFKLISPVLGVIFGIIIIAIGANFSGNHYSYNYDGIYIQETEHIKYGGDAYTGIQNAAADAANNTAVAVSVIENINSNLAKFAGSIDDVVSTGILVVGIATLGFYCVKIADILVAELVIKKKEAEQE